MEIQFIHFIEIHGLTFFKMIYQLILIFSYRFTKLQFLDLTLATISSDCLLSLISACRSLRKISLETLALNSLIFE